MSPDLDDDVDELATAAVGLRREIAELLAGAEPDAALMALISSVGKIGLDAGVDRAQAHDYADGVARDLHEFFDYCFDEGAEQLRSGLN